MGRTLLRNDANSLVLRLLHSFCSVYLDQISLLSSYLCVLFGHGLMCYEVGHAVLSCFAGYHWALLPA